MGAAEFAAAFPDLDRQPGLDRDAVAEMISSAQDVFVAACANQ